MGGEGKKRYCGRVPLRAATMLFDSAACVNACYVTWGITRILGFCDSKIWKLKRVGVNAGWSVFNSRRSWVLRFGER